MMTADAARFEEKFEVSNLTAAVQVHLLVELSGGTRYRASQPDWFGRPLGMTMRFGQKGAGEIRTGSYQMWCDPAATTGFC